MLCCSGFPGTTKIRSEPLQYTVLKSHSTENVGMYIFMQNHVATSDLGNPGNHMLQFRKRDTGSALNNRSKTGSDQETLGIFQEANRFDDSLGLGTIELSHLSKKRIVSTSFSFDHLFKNLSESQPCLYFDYESDEPGNSYGLGMSKAELLPVLRETEEPFQYKINRELDKEPVKLTIRELMQEWEKDDQYLRVTNIHLRSIDLIDTIKLDRICPFNLLVRGNEDLKKLEMMTLMVSTTGAITESHSDDADVNNHCVTGRKLWLCWDASEGMKAGLEDCEKMDVFGKPEFEMETFLQLASSYWVLVSEGDTLFLPGNYVHKVITLEKYVGVGGFFVSFPTLLNTFGRWLGRQREFQRKDTLYRRRLGIDVAESIERSLLNTSQKIFYKRLNVDEAIEDLLGINYFRMSVKKGNFSINFA